MLEAGMVFTVEPGLYIPKATKRSTLASAASASGSRTTSVMTDRRTREPHGPPFRKPPKIPAMDVETLVNGRLNSRSIETLIQTIHFSRDL